MNQEMTWESEAEEELARRLNRMGWEGERAQHVVEEHVGGMLCLYLLHLVYEVYLKFHNSQIFRTTSRS